MGREIDNIRAEMEDDGVIQVNTKKSVDWLVKNIEELTEGKTTTLINEMKRQGDNRIVPRIGKFYMFSYLAKHRNTLPYYDRFPLIIVLSINPKEEYMIGLNMHYLPLKIRATLFKSILTFLNNKKWDDTTKFKISWQLLQTLSTSPITHAAVKRYNFSQLRSKFIIVEEEEWDIVLMLPTHQFKGATVADVWRDSLGIINERKPRRPQRRMTPRRQTKPKKRK